MQEYSLQVGTRKILVGSVMAQSCSSLPLTSAQTELAARCHTLMCSSCLRCSPRILAEHVHLLKPVGGCQLT